MNKNITARDSKPSNGCMAMIDGAKLLTEQEVHLVVDRYQNGQTEAFEELKKNEMRFVVAAAKQYVDKGLTLDELVEAGTDGLELAAQRFAPSRGFKFIPYAIWYIKHSILLALKACGSEEGVQLFNESEEREAKIKEFDSMLRSGKLPENVSTAIDQLPAREKDIIMYSYGIESAPCTDEEICMKFGLTKPRLLQIRSQVMMKLRKRFIK